MDQGQITTIAVTAVVSVIAKEVLVWLVGLVKGAASVSTAKALFGAIFNRTNLAILSELLALALYVYLIVHVGWTDSPVTGKDVLIMAGCALGALVFISSLLIRLAKAAIARDRARTKDAA